MNSKPSALNLPHNFRYIGGARLLDYPHQLTTYIKKPRLRLVIDG
jgi:hypothetical protein